MSAETEKTDIEIHMFIVLEAVAAGADTYETIIAFYEDNNKRILENYKCDGEQLEKFKIAIRNLEQEKFLESKSDGDIKKYVISSRGIDKLEEYKQKYGAR